MMGQDNSCIRSSIRKFKKTSKSRTRMNAAALLVFVFCASLMAFATVNAAEFRVKRSAYEADAIKAESDMLIRKRRGDIDWPCTGKCSAYWACRAKGLFIFGDCDYPSGCECKCFAWQNC